MKDNAELIKGLGRGDYRSYETLFRLYYARFVNFADTIIKDRAAAKDIVQEAFIKVWVNRARLNSNLSLQNYLYVLVKRAVINFLRDRKFAKDISVSTLENLAADLSTDKTVDADETRERIRTCVQEMPEQRRTAFLLSRNGALSNKEIAAEMNLSVKTVERHISLALSDLRKNLS